MFSKAHFVKKGKFFVGTILCNISQTRTGFFHLKNNEYQNNSVTAAAHN